MTLVHEPGSTRHIDYRAGRNADGTYKVTRWGTVEEQIAEATSRNLELSSSVPHTSKQLYMFAEDCGHEYPDANPKFDGLDDLVDAWMDRNCGGLNRRDSIELYWRNISRAHANIPLYIEYKAAGDEYGDLHSGNVCLDEPMGSCCTECTEGDDDSGYEPEGCRRQEYARDRWDEFWDSVSTDASEYRARKAENERHNAN